MTENNVPERTFQCNFQDIPFYSRFILWVAVLVFAIVIFSVTRNIVIILLFIPILIFFPTLSEFNLRNIRKKSYIYLTDEEIKIKVWGRKSKSYEIKYIEKVCLTFNSNLHKRDYILPVVFGLGTEDIIPREGVLVFFKREYHKSVRPVLFNPSDSILFIKSLNEIRRITRK